MENLTTPIVAKEYFTERSFIFSSKESMQALQEITVRREFAKSLKHIHVALGNASLSTMPGKTRSQRAERRSRKREVRSLRQAAAHFRNGPVVECLAKITTNLMRVGNAPAITASSNELARCGSLVGRMPWGHPLGFNRMHEAGNGTMTLCHGMDDIYPIAIVMDVLEHTGLAPQRLEFGDVGASLPLLMFEGIKNHEPAYCNLNVLKLAISPETGWPEGELNDDRKVQYLQDFLNMLRSAQKISAFSLHGVERNIFRGSHVATFAAIAEARLRGEVLPSLRYLSLDSHAIKLLILRTSSPATKIP